MIHTNRCKHCGKTKEEHIKKKHRKSGYDGTLLCGLFGPPFEDSGLAALDAHKEELYQLVEKLAKWSKAYPRGPIYPYSAKVDEQLIAIEEEAKLILNQIEKEK